jgi:hypothetical protein
MIFMYIGNSYFQYNIMLFNVFLQMGPHYALKD